MFGDFYHPMLVSILEQFGLDSCLPAEEYGDAVQTLHNVRMGIDSGNLQILGLNARVVRKMAWGKGGKLRHGGSGSNTFKGMCTRLTGNILVDLYAGTCSSILQIVL